MTGNFLWESTPLSGVQAGTPQPTSDGRYVMVNYNLEQSTGYFSVLDTSQAAPGAALAAAYTGSNQTNPFSPLGVYHNPSEGYYDGGEGNTNDMFVWAFDTAGDAQAVGVGQMFGFQMPVDGSSMEYMLLGGSRTFQASLPPVLTNQGRSMYWAVTKAEQRCWVGSATTSAARFSRGRTETANFARGSPPYASAKAPPSVSSDVAQPIVYGPSATNQIWRMNFDYSQVLTMDTTSIVSSRIAVSPQGDRIYYVTNNGLLVQANADTLETIWTLEIGAPVEADITLNPFGTMLYVADTIGNVRGIQVAESDGVTEPPVPMPTTAPVSPVPTPEPVPTVAPPPTTPSPTKVPTADLPTPSDAPEPAPTAASSASFDHSPLSRVLLLSMLARGLRVLL